MHNRQRRHAQRGGVHTGTGDEQREAAQPAGLPQHTGARTGEGDRVVLEPGREGEAHGAEHGERDGEQCHDVRLTCSAAMAKSRT
ncbi:hypothetical protein Lesp01_47130 [Lentzea sp. NBRC 102530]|nr:hypothetical protein Lesp01_47130 [Lentzea sp. NBRC 102530]